jgi:hypothetical protein
MGVREQNISEFSAAFAHFTDVLGQKWEPYIETREQLISDCRLKVEMLVGQRNAFEIELLHLRSNRKSADIETYEILISHLDKRISDLKDILAAYEACFA